MYYTIRDLNKLSHGTAKKIARKQGTQRQAHPAYGDIKRHPTCTTDGCDNSRTVMDWHWTSGQPVYRPVCSQCHDAKTAAGYAAKTGATWVKTVADVCAHKEGFNSSQEWVNSKHPYKRHRLDYCENRDGRLGTKCTTTIVWTGQLDTHHVIRQVDGGSDDPTNLWTLCKCCHALAHRDQEQTTTHWN
jgi:cytochrome c1